MPNRCYSQARRVWLLAALCALGVGNDTLRAENPVAGDRETIDQLIHDLGDKSYKVRDAAARRLVGMEEAEPALTKALASTDLETARLAARILDERQKRETARVFRIIRREFENGEIDRAVDRLVTWNGSESDASSWQLVMDCCWEIHGRAAKLRPVTFKIPQGAKPPPKSTNDFEQGANYVASPRKPVSVKHHYGCIRAKGIAAQQGLWGVFVSSDGYEMRGTQSGSLFVVNGSFGSVITLSNCILICDGDVRITGAIANSIVIARGTVHCPNAVYDSVIVSSGAIFDTEARKTKLPSGFTTLPNEATPLNFVKWFSPADVGLEIASKKDEIKVEKLFDGMVPQKSGLKLGDVITAVDGGKVDSAESFRKLLRRGSVQDRCVLSIKRGEKSLEIVLDFRAEERAKERALDPEKK